MKKLIVCAATLFVVMIATTAESMATVTVNFHAVANCKQDLTNSAFNGTLSVNSADQWTNSNPFANTGVLLICPLVLPEGSGSTFTMTGWSSGTNTLSVQVCKQAYAGGSPVCGPWANSSGTGVAHLTATAPSWTGNDFLFLSVDIGGTSSGPSFWGYSFTYVPLI